MTAEVIKLARRMREIQKRQEEIDVEWKPLAAELDELRLKLIPEAMAEQDIRSLTIEGVGRVQLAMDLYATITNKHEGYEWLKANGYEGLVTEYAQPSTFKAAVKLAIKDGQQFPEELFSITPFTRASIVNT